MNKITIKEIKKLRDETRVGVMDCKRALEECNGNFQKATEWLRKKGVELAAKRKSRKVKQGLISSYIHAGGRVGAMVEVLCETDFVAKNDEFQKLGKELAMQVAAMDPASVERLLEQEYIRDPQKKVKDLIDESIGKLGENIAVGRIKRFEIGEEGK
jgi:elongation factor Ts